MKHLHFYISFEDQRGLFWGIVQEGTWTEANYIETKQDVVRGGHFHKETRELFFIIDGKISIKIVNLRDSVEKQFIAEKGCIFIVEPFEIHTFKVLMDSKWINMLSKGINKDKPDIYRTKNE